MKSIRSPGQFGYKPPEALIKIQKMHYSYRNDSMGSRREAFMAG